MPKKEKEGDGQGGGKKKGKKNAKKVVIGPPAPEPLSDQTREFYLVQIRDLEHRIERYQKKCDELEVRNGEYQKKFDKMTDDKKDIVLFIKKKLDEKTDEIAEVNDQLIGLQQAKDAEKDSFEQQLQQLRTEYQETKDHLTSENMILGGKLASLEEFKIQREELLEKMESLEQELYDQDRKHKENVYLLEKKQVIDKDRLKKEMIQRVNQVAAEFRKVSNRQMAETTKRTIRENVAINTQLTKLSEKTIEMITENDGLKERERKQRQQIEILEANEKELAKKHIANQKLIQMLTEKCKEHEKMLLDFETKKEQYKLLESEVDLLRTQLEHSRTEILLINEQNQELERELIETRTALEERSITRKKLEKLVLEAVSALQDVIHDSVGEDCSDSTSDIGTKRTVVIENLIHLLNSSLELEKRFEIRTEGESDSAQGTSLPDRHSRYQLGDLGLIPRPELHIPTSLNKIKHLESAHSNSLKKILNKSVATQTVSTAKAMFLADQLISKLPSSSSKDNNLRSSSGNSVPSRSLPPVIIPNASKQISANMY